MIYTRFVRIYGNCSNASHNIEENKRETDVMIKNAYVTIVASDELTQMHLDELVGRKGLVVEDLSFMETSPRGGMVLLEEAYLDEFTWFIPENAVVYE